MTIVQTSTALYTIASKEIGRFLRIWTQTLLPSVITMVMYLIIFGTFIGNRIHVVEHIDYIQFIIPGLIMMSVITNAYTNVVSSFYLGKFTRHIEELLVSPTPNYVILIGYTIGGVLRGLVVGILISIISLLFTKISLYNIPLTILFILLTSILFSLAGFLNSLFAKSFDDISLIPTFILTPLSYLGGVFYSIDLLPKFWQVVSRCNPILYMVNGFRYGFLGTSDVSVMAGLYILISCIAILFITNLILLRRGFGIKT